MPHRILKTAHAQEIADGLTVVSGGAALFSWLAELDVVISIVAGIVAITAGSLAGYYHILNIRRIKKTKPKD